MKLTRFTDYSFRVLLYLGSLAPGEVATVESIAKSYKISKNHLVKTVQNLTAAGLVHTMRGKGGGIYLAPGANSITLRKIVQLTEPDFCLVECFDRKLNRCCIAGSCSLAGALDVALQSFFRVLEQYTLRDICRDAHQRGRRAALGI